MKKYIYILLIILLSHCSGNNKKILPEDEFVNLLVEIHISDAILTEKALIDGNIKYSDSISYYNFIFHKYNLNRQEFDYNIDYYYKEHERYIEVYKQVIKILERKKEVVDSLVMVQAEERGELWELKTEWKLPDDGQTNPIKYKVDVQEHGTYILTAEILLQNIEKNENLKMIISANYKDTVTNTKSVILEKNKDWKTYILKIETYKDKKITTISGSIFKHTKNVKKINAEIKSISLILDEK